MGATCNPVIALQVLKKEMASWKPHILELARQHPTLTDDELGWRVVEEMSVRAAKLLHPIFEAQEGRNGRLSIQTDPRNWRDARRLADQAERFSKLAPNMIVKIPVTSAGVEAIEEATYRGVSINATVSFTLPQCVAVAEAVERGLRRREKEGKPVATMGPVCTIMVGRLDDWMKVAAEREHLTLDPGHLDWAGVAVFKDTYKLYRQRGYRLRLLSAAFRNHLHWSELIGGDVVISPPYSWIQRLDTSGIPGTPRMDRPVAPEILASLQRISEYRRASTEGGLSVAEFESYGATRRTLRQFLAACGELDALIRDLLVPNPD